MTKQDIITLLTADFYEGFAEQCGKIIIEQQGVDALFGLLTDTIVIFNVAGMKKDALSRIGFRAAYALDYIYFSNNKVFDKYYQNFFFIFPLVTNESTKRHFAKVMADILAKDNYLAELADYESVASACVDWIINEKVRVAVQVWAVECLIRLKGRVGWVPDILDDILDKLSINPSPGMIVRLRGWRNS
ncbi:MAG: hypothetical protein A2X18_14260 [Bacteroidetes bacterium GWF2_40_14]|nr:MAG: hypothetical protein A2X18_14260 [Bacteroidetes bacterium GWF2_40_14]